MFALGRSRDPDRTRWCLNREVTPSPGFAIHIFFSPLLLTLLIVFSSLRASGQSAAPHSPGQKEKPGESSGSPSPQQLYKRLSPSVFVVETLDTSGSVVAKGSAVAITSGEVVTNRHVIEEGVSWRLRRGSQTWPSIITHLDPDHDLCQLKAKGLATRPVLVRSSTTLAVGERVFAIGAPEGLELTMSEGLVSGLREYENAHLIQTSAPISPGSSGGGLFDAQGRLVGITTFFFKEGQNLNFALPGEWVQALAKQAVSSNQKGRADTPAFQALLLMQIGFKAFGDGDYKRASDAYHEALRLQPNLADAWYWLGAIAELQPIKLISEGKEPNWPEAYEQALEAYTKALELRPDFAGAWSALGNAYSGLGRKAEGVHAEQEAVRLNPRLGLAWAELGMLYHDLGENQKALKAYQQALVVEPDNTTALVMLGVLYKDLHQYDEMVNSLEKAVQLDPSMPGAWFSLGEAYAAQNNRKKVIEVYERLKTLRPDLADEFFRKFVLP
ncbi:MAG TPA: tetratricopeptide repeat-containing serine protease family protein [Candidatus Acidoferrum sp.]|nr:tetratricopeptide repeat-containing serine protease family protein [Candidatus Acidoferrum sp.]